MLELVFRRDSGALRGLDAVCMIAPEITSTGQAMIPDVATVEGVIRMTYNTPTCTHGYKLAATDSLIRPHPDVLRSMNLPSQGRRLSEVCRPPR